MRLILPILFVIFYTTSWAQAILLKGEQVDSIQIMSHIGWYQFDDHGTTKGKTEVLTVTYSNSEKSYIISDYWKEKYKITFEPKTYVRKHKILKNKMGTQINDTLITELLEALSSSENPIETFSKLTDMDLNSFVNEKTILQVAKWYELDWQFKVRYSTKEQNEKFFKGCQSLDTFNVYLNERFDTIAYFIITDFSNTIDIRIVTENFEYKYEGKYSNPVKQPWYHQSKSSKFFAQPILNLNINRTLELILPEDFLLKSTISREALMNDYITWYFERREMKY